jgi:glycosyltransferase involved in cell wall biosynthesis
MNRVEFCIPAKNEECIIEENVLRLISFLTKENPSYTWNISIVSNGSTDTTNSIIQKLQIDYPHQITPHILQESGKGRAIRTCFDMSDADILVFIDADLSTSLSNIPHLLQPLHDGSCDISIGSRYLNKSVHIRPLSRKIISRAYNTLCKFVLGSNVTDLQCGFKAFTRKTYNGLQDKLSEEGWFFDTEILMYAQYNQHTIYEVPIDYRENRYKIRTSRIKIKDIFTFLLKIYLFKIKRNNEA